MGRNYADENARRNILRQWRAKHGNVCPGTEWCKIPNSAHVTSDLTVDHTVAQVWGFGLTENWSVMCRSANSRKGSR